MDNEFETKKFSYDELAYLRKATMLGPIAMVKIAKARKEAELLRKYFAEVEHENIGLDYSTANELEYNYRRQALQRRIFKDWQQYGDGLDFEEYTDMVIANNAAQSKNKSL